MGYIEIYFLSTVNLNIGLIFASNNLSKLQKSYDCGRKSALYYYLS